MKTEKSKGKKNKKALLIVLLSIVAAILLYAVFNIFSCRIFYGEFYAHAQKAHGIPDLWGGFLPQGVTDLDGKTLICGYKSGEPSRICLFEDGGVKTVELSEEDGSVYDGHAGGVSAYRDYIYISNASKIFVLRSSDLLSAKDGDTLRFCGRFDVPVRSSFCSCDGKYLYVGEFHRDGYETKETHLVKSADGEQQALIFAYPIDESAPFFVRTEPERVYSVCDEVQGAAFENGRAALSCSYGLPSSRLHIYNCTGAPDGRFSADGTDLPLYILDAQRLQKTFSLPHMSEDIEFTDRGLLIAFEGGALKYGGGLLPCSEGNVVLFDLTSALEENR